MKILLTGNIFHSYDISIKNALESLGHRVDIYFNNIEGPFYANLNTVKWLKYGFLPYQLKINYFVKKATANYNQLLLEAISKNNYDLLLVIKGLSIDEYILKKFDGYKVLWMLDSIKRFSEVQKTIKQYDKVYSYEPSDLPYCEEVLNQSIDFLPVGYDSDHYHKLDTSVLSDFSFVGGIRPNREPVIQQLIDLGGNIRLIGDFHKSSNQKIRRSCIARIASHQFINSVYNSSKINLNIHKPQSEMGCNPRFYEILGAGGGIQFSEPRKSVINDFTDGKDLVYYTSIEELLNKSEFYLRKESIRTKISLTAYNNVKNNHTWRHRVLHILNNIDI